MKSVQVFAACLLFVFFALGGCTHYKTATEPITQKSIDRIKELASYIKHGKTGTLYVFDDEVSFAEYLKIRGLANLSSVDPKHEHNKITSTSYLSYDNFSYVWQHNFDGLLNDGPYDGCFGYQQYFAEAFYTRTSSLSYTQGLMGIYGQYKKQNYTGCDIYEGTSFRLCPTGNCFLGYQVDVFTYDLPSSGGVFQYFSQEIDDLTMATGQYQLTHWYEIDASQNAVQLKDVKAFILAP
ncbi:hypothetical protein L0337_12525 [candidate division KSB1 bacterium]|nr:hypothetical protein [candidate division KSB1 bacterium]